ncbi:DUF928 domain-containing protein [Phormidesmis sp. 146-35]
MPPSNHPDVQCARLRSLQVTCMASLIGFGLAGTIIAPTFALERQHQTSQLPPPPPNPGSTAPGGRRDDSACPQDTQKPNPVLTALSPTNSVGLTVAKQPTILVYVPQTKAQSAEFNLSNPAGGKVYRTTLALTNTPTIVQISLPADVPPIAVGKDYLWSFAVICNPQNRFHDRFVTGEIRRIEPSPALMQQIQQATPQERLTLYRQYRSANLWYDALITLFELRNSQPNDAKLDAVWRELLQSAGVSEITPQLIQKIPPTAK